MKARRANPCRLRVLVVAATVAHLAAGCGSRDAVPDPSDGVLAAVRCEPWRPSEADWSSLPTSRPAIIGSVSASPSGKYLYSVGTWLDAGNVRRQILRSPDLGESWCVLPTPAPVSEIAPSRASETVLYALTCARDGTAAQMLKTTDGGATWTAPAAGLPDGFDDCTGASSLLQTSVTEPGVVWLSLSSTSVLYPKMLLLSGDGGESWASVPSPPALVQSQGLPVDPADPTEAVVDGLLVDPRSSNAAGRVLAWGSTGTLRAGFGPERWFTTEDAGNTWREITAPPLAADASRSALVVADVVSSIYVMGGPVLFRSSDWGETWAPAGRLPEAQTRLTTLGSRSAGRLFAWNLDAGNRPDVDPTVWRSLDRGSTWSALAVPTYPAIDPVLAPGGADVIIGLGGLGISTTANGGRTWTQRPIIPAPGNLAQSPVDRRRIWADDWTSGSNWSTRGTSFPGLQSTDGGLNWTVMGDASGRLLMDGASADVAFLGMDWDAPQRTEDGGQTWTSFSVPASSIRAAAICPPPASCLYVQSFDGTADCRLTRSDDHGRTWAAKQPLPAEVCYGALLAVSPETPEHLLASCATTICETRDGGQSWTSHSIGADPDRTIRSFLFMGGDVVLATTSTEAPLGDTKPSVLARSVDGGSTWTDVLAEGGTLVASVAHPETAFLIGDRFSQGSQLYSIVFRSDDSGATWNLASPSGADQPGAGDPGFNVLSIVDAPGGGFLASTLHGLVQFK